jgi:hypothetical protein
MMIVGLKSGKEFVVNNGHYTMSNDATGEKTHIFNTETRIITVRDGDIEFWDEARTPERMDMLKAVANRERPIDPPGNTVDVV